MYNLKGKAEPMVLQVADCSVVVSKSEPMKAGNSMEEKTRMKVCIMSYFLPNSQKE
jgi:hypothetical protein